jgi:hypothetical protein
MFVSIEPPYCSTELHLQSCEDFGSDMPALQPELHVQVTAPNRRVVLDLWRVLGRMLNTHLCAGRISQEVPPWPPVVTLRVASCELMRRDAEVLCKDVKHSIKLELTFLTGATNTSHGWPSSLKGTRRDLQLDKYSISILLEDVFHDNQLVGFHQNNMCSYLRCGPPPLATPRLPLVLCSTFRTAYQKKSV